jgi:hypothetical protein
LRIYGNLLEAAKEIERDLWELGANVSTRSMQDKVGEFPTKELIGYQFLVPGLAQDWDQLAKFMGLDIEVFRSYTSKELGDRIEGVSNPGFSWEVRREEWERYLHGGKFSYTYPERIWDPTNQFGHCYSVLKNDPSSRQAIIQIYDKNRDFVNTGGRARIPCSLVYQFIRRKSDVESKLHCIYTMRSCDFYRHWAYDMVLGTLMLSFLAGKLNWLTGNLIMQIGSFHAYEEDLKKRKIF